MFCAQPHCDWWDGFKRPDDAKRAAQFHELTGGDVRGELRAHLGEAYPAAQRPSRCP